MLWSVSNVARQHRLVVAGMCQRSTNLHSHNEEETRLTLAQEATERTKQGKTEKQTKTHTKMNKSASLTPVQGPSTVACMIVT
jgi:hypothetical protein